MLFERGDYANNLYFVIEGVVKAGIVDAEDKEISRRLFVPGDVAGLEGLLGLRTHNMWARGLKMPVQVVVVPVLLIRQLMQNNADITKTVLTIAGSYLQRTDRELEIMLAQDVRSRVIWFLQRYTDWPDDAAIHYLAKNRITQIDIAQIVGATRQTVAGVINELKRENIAGQSEFV